MKKDVVLAGLFAGIAMFIWLFVTNAVIPMKSNMVHKIAPNQLEIHKVLKDNITEPGTYACPYLTHEEEQLLPDYRNQPVYSIIYSGGTHGDTGEPAMFIPILIIFAVPLLAAWMLSMTSNRIRASYCRRLFFVVCIGVIISLYDDVLQMSFGPQPKDYLVFLAVNNFITWVLAGLIIAWRIRPATQ
jgi:hypothetical protein